MKRYIVSGLLLITGFTVCIPHSLFFWLKNSEPAFNPSSSIFVDYNHKKSVYEEKEGVLLAFIKNKLIRSDGGIVTNTRPVKGDPETLSESVGLLMHYAVMEDKKDLFDIEFNFLKDRLLANGYNVRWKLGVGEITCNAAIDDLRIIRALIGAYEKWGVKSHLDMAKQIQGNIYNKQVKNNNLFEIYDWKYDTVRQSTPLCYLDLYTLDRARLFDKNWKGVSVNALKITSEGKIQDSPFFFKYYDYKKSKYLMDEEYKDNNGICITYTIYTALHLAEVGIKTGDLIDWLNNEMKRGNLYAWYNPHNLKPVSDVESTAVYALASIYAKRLGDYELSKKLINRMLEFMVVDQNSLYYGGFGNKDAGEFYSFDNLTALWALSEIIKVQ